MEFDRINKRMLDNGHWYLLNAGFVFKKTVSRFMVICFERTQTKRRHSNHCISRPKRSNTIIVTRRFINMDAAMALAHSGGLKPAMTNSGVSSLPEIWFGDEFESTPF